MARSAGRRPGVIALALLLALLSVAAMAEGVLRLGEWLSLRSRGGDAAEGKGAVTILCVGDSWTFGLESGDPSSKSYPARLQQKLDAVHGPGRFKVINRGKPGNTSHALANELPQMLEEFKPALVTLLVGATNFFAIPEFTQGANGIRPAPPDALGPLERLRVVRVARMFFRPPWSRRTDQAQAKITQDFREKLRLLTTQGMVGAGGGEGPDPGFGSGAGAAKEEENPEDPRQVLEDLWLRRNKTARRAWPADADDTLNRLTHNHPKMTAAHRLLILGMIERNRDACGIKNALKVAAKACPTCTWPGRVMDGLAREVDLPAGRLLWHNMLQAKRAVVQAGARFFLLNYPKSDIDQCGQAPRDVIMRFAAAQTVPLLDIGQVLGPQVAGGDLRYYAEVDGHPNGQGYKRIAEALYERLKELNWLHP